MRKLILMWCLALLAGCGNNGGTAPTTPPTGGISYSVEIRRTEFGIPHIKADNFDGLAYGYGYAFAEDNLCVIADSYVTVNAERSRYFGPDETYVFQGNGLTVNNLRSDFFFRQIMDEGRIEALLAQPPPAGPRPEVKQAVLAYVAGYNRYLRDTGVDKLPDPTCRGKPWVRPITEMDAYRRFYQLALLASSGVAFDGIFEAQPPALAAPSATSAYSPAQVTEHLRQGFAELAIGSNAIALGKNATANGRGMLLGNPHFPWYGSERFYQIHLTIPGKVNVAGASLFGAPLVLVGHTESLAWSHTVSTAYRFTPYELTLVPGTPTSYLVDGAPEPMTARAVSVQALTAGGTLETRTRTLYSTRYGPMFSSIFNLPIFPWTPARAFALADANAANFRYLNHFFEMNQAKTTDEALAVLERNQGIPWVTTLASDRAGKALFADISAVPNVPDNLARTCGTELGQATFAGIGLPILDGSRSGCAWAKDADAIQPGTFGPANMPRQFRDDYVLNSNDSYWLSNPEAPQTGYARIIGNVNTPRNLRTRIGHIMIREQLANDGTFTRQQLQDLVFNNRNYSGEIWRDALVTMCESYPGGNAMSSSGPVSVGGACDALAGWDLHDDLDSNGAMVFRRFAGRLLGTTSLPQGSQGSQGLDPLIYLTPFNPTDPVNTPGGLNVLSPLVHQSFGDALQDLKGAGIPMDAPLRGFQFEPRGDEKIPIHGGSGTVGVFNAINAVWAAGEGYTNIRHGSSYVQVVSFDDSPCPDVRTILTYSQSTNPASLHYADQTRLYSNKQWVQPPFCEADVAAATRTTLSLTE